MGEHLCQKIRIKLALNSVIAITFSRLLYWYTFGSATCPTEPPRTAMPQCRPHCQYRHPPLPLQPLVFVINRFLAKMNGRTLQTLQKQTCFQKRAGWAGFAPYFDDVKHTSIRVITDPSRICQQKLISARSVVHTLRIRSKCRFEQVCFRMLESICSQSMNDSAKSYARPGNGLAIYSLCSDVIITFERVTGFRLIQPLIDK